MHDLVKVALYIVAAGTASVGFYEFKYGNWFGLVPLAAAVILALWVHGHQKENYR